MKFHMHFYFIFTQKPKKKTNKKKVYLMIHTSHMLMCINFKYALCYVILLFQALTNILERGKEINCCLCFFLLINCIVAISCGVPHFSYLESNIIIMSQKDIRGCMWPLQKYTIWFSGYCLPLTIIIKKLDLNLIYSNFKFFCVYVIIFSSLQEL